MEKYIKIKNKKLGTTNEPKKPYLDFEGNYCNLKVSTIEDYDIYFDKLYYKENNIIIIPKRDFTYTDPSTGTIYSGLYNYTYRNFGDKNSGFQYKNYPECMVDGNTDKFVRDAGGHVTKGMYTLPQSYLDELTNIRPIGSASNAFWNHYCLTTLKGIETTWDTSQITYFGYMFACCGQDNPETGTLVSIDGFSSKYPVGTIDLSNWDFSSSIGTGGMFYSSYFKLISNKPIDLKNTTNTSSMFEMYHHPYIPDIITNNVIKTSRMFYDSYIVNPPKLNTHNVTDMSLMFGYCYNLSPKFPWVIDCSSITETNGLNKLFISTSVNEVYLYNIKEELKSQITGELLNSSVNNMNIHFVDSLDVEIDNTLKASDSLTISNMYIQREYTTYLPDNIDTSNITTAKYLFANFSKINAIPKIDTSNVTNMMTMFYNCQSLVDIPEFDTSKVTCMYGMFRGCTSLPAEFPWPIDCSSIDMIGEYKGSYWSGERGISGIFIGSSVKKAKFKNLRESIKISLKPEDIKDKSFIIEFVD